MSEHCKYLHLDYDWHKKVVKTTTEYLLAVLVTNMRCESLPAVWEQLDCILVRDTTKSHEDYE